MLATKIIYIFWKIIGLCPYGLTNRATIRVSFVGTGYAIILSSVYLFFDLSTMEYKTNIKIKQQTVMSKISAMCGHLVESSMIVTVWISFGVHQTRLRTMQRSFLRMMEARGLLGIQVGHRDSMKSAQYQVAICNTIWLCTLIISMNNRLFNSGIFDTVFCSIAHIVPPNFVLFYVGLMVTIRDHFRTFNTKLREICEHVDTKDFGVDQPIRSTKSTKSGSEGLVASDVLDALGRVHTEMIDLTRSVIDFVSPSLYLSVINHLIQLSSIIYIVCLAATSGIIWHVGTRSNYIIFTAWFFIHIVAIIAETVLADSVTYEANKAGDLLHEILTLRPTTRSTVSANMWSLRLLRNPLSIKLFGVLEMKYSVIYKICSISVTCVTIMVQLDEQNEQDEHEVNGSELPSYHSSTS